MFFIDLMSRTPIYEQIVKQTENYILKGILKSNDQMPSVRSLSLSLKTNPNTVQKAFSELDHLELIYSVPGKGSFISEGAKEILSKRGREKIGIFKEMAKELYHSGMDKVELISIIEDVYNNK